MPVAQVSLLPLASIPSQEVATLHEVSATAAYRHIFSGPFPRAEAQQRWREHSGAGLVAVQNAEPVGFIAWTDDVLDALYVLPQHAGRGTGTRLLAAAPDEVSRLWVLAENLPGRRFYEQRGWADTGLTRVAYEGVDEVLYRR